MGRKVIGAPPRLIGHSPQKDPADFLPPTTCLIPSASGHCPLSLQCSICGRWPCTRKSSPPHLSHPVLSVSNLCCQLISQCKSICSLDQEKVWLKVTPTPKNKGPWPYLKVRGMCLTSEAQGGCEYEEGVGDWFVVFVRYIHADFRTHIKLWT